MIFKNDINLDGRISFEDFNSFIKGILLIK